MVRFNTSKFAIILPPRIQQLTDEIPRHPTPDHPQKFGSRTADPAKELSEENPMDFFMNFYGLI